MLSLAVSSSDFIFSCHSLKGLGFQSFPSVILYFDAKRSRRWRRKRSSKVVSLSSIAAREGSSLLLFSDFVRKGNWCKVSTSGSVRRCKDWDSVGDFALEAEILEFMKYSKNREAFPTKEELIEAGRMDLVDAVVKKGGWLSLGWDVDEEGESGREIGANSSFSLLDNETYSVKDEMMKIERDEINVSGLVSSFENYSQSATSSGRSVVKEANDESGVEGILHRLEKQRNDALGVGFEQHKDLSSQNKGDKEEWHSDPQQVRQSVASKGITDKSIINGNRTLSNIDNLKDTLKPETWRTWSFPRARSTEIDFEAAEITPSDTCDRGLKEIPENEMFEIRAISGYFIGNGQKSDCLDSNLLHIDVRTRLRHMESELSTVLHSLKYTSGGVAAKKGNESYPNELHKLFDAWEFQENEFMNVRDRLRSLRAKIAVIEGKMALAMIDAQKIVEEKQKKIDDAQRALRLLRTTWVVWSIAASEVLLAGSYDGWATQRKMEKSSTGIFYMCLTLYPGRYEIKFIVDGEWKVDPLRPLTGSSGYKNNLLIIS